MRDDGEERIIIRKKNPNKIGLDVVMISMPMYVKGQDLIAHLFIFLD